MNYIRRLNGPYNSLKGSLDTSMLSGEWVANQMYMDHVLGLTNDYQPSWGEMDVVYGPFNINEHWMVVCFDLVDDELLIWDPMSSYVEFEKVVDELTPVGAAIPSLLGLCGVFQIKTGLPKVPWKIHRIS